MVLPTEWGAREADLWRKMMILLCLQGRGQLDNWMGQSAAQNRGMYVVDLPGPKTCAPNHFILMIK